VTGDGYSKNLIIYRTCDRPRYTAITLPHFLKNTSHNAHILIAENSSNEETTALNKQCFDDSLNRDPSMATFEYLGPRVGVQTAVHMSIDAYVKKFDRPPERVYLMDDDILVPTPINEGEYWDTLLETMLLSDTWDVVGIHRIATSSRIEGEGLAKGHVVRFVGGACSAFKYAIYKNSSWRQEYSRGRVRKGEINGYNIWVSHNVGKHGRCARFASYPFYYTDIDKHGHELSLRETEYIDYSTEIWWQRHPQHRDVTDMPKGAK
jgi:hypothetical protein